MCKTIKCGNGKLENCICPYTLFPPQELSSPGNCPLSSDLSLEDIQAVIRLVRYRCDSESRFLLFGWGVAVQHFGLNPSGDFYEAVGRFLQHA